MIYKHPDLHMHSMVSDGSDTPLELLEKVRQSDVDMFSLTDHDTFDGCEAISKSLKEGDPLFLPGIELSTRDANGKYHILGYCYDKEKSAIAQAVNITHNARRQKAENRILFLQKEHGFTFTDEELAALMENENPGRPHFVALLLKKGYVQDKAEGFRLMAEYHGQERRLTPEEAIDSILSADGIPVLAHGILADGSKRLTEAEITERVLRLKGFGLMGLECFYSSYDDAQTKIMLSLAEQNNLMVTAGSDYHGKNKPVKIGESGNPDPERLSRFYRAVSLLLGM